MPRFCSNSVCIPFCSIKLGPHKPMCMEPCHCMGMHNENQRRRAANSSQCRLLVFCTYTQRRKNAPNIFLIRGFTARGFSQHRRPIQHRSNLEYKLHMPHIAPARIRKLPMSMESACPLTVSFSTITVAICQRFSVFQILVFLSLGGFRVLTMVHRGRAPDMRVYPATNGVVKMNEGGRGQLLYFDSYVLLRGALAVVYAKR